MIMGVLAALPMEMAMMVAVFPTRPMGVAMMVGVLAAPPIPSKVITVKVSEHNSQEMASIVLTWLNSTTARPTDSQIFYDEEEVLASFNSANSNWNLCELGMTTTSRFK